MTLLFARAVAAFKQVSAQFPGDVGLWMVFFLNVLDLQPGDGLFLAANEPHAYLAGDCVEIMAASDNVIRAGLTPKFKDVDTLLNSLTYKTDSLEQAAFKSDPNLAVQGYIPPAIIPEFRLERVTCVKQKRQQQQQQEVEASSLNSSSPSSSSKVRVPLHSASIFIVLNSDAKTKDLARVSRIVTESEGSKVIQTTTSSIGKGDIHAVLLLESSSSLNTKQQQIYLEFENLSSDEDLVCFVAQTRGDGHALSSKI